jgi:hypothetical protein
MKTNVRAQQSALTVPARLVSLYQRAGYSQAALEDAAKLSRDTLAGWGRFETVPNLIELGEVANALHVSNAYCASETKPAPALAPAANLTLMRLA